MLYLTEHAEVVMREREIALEWVTRTVLSASFAEDHDDGTRHFLRRLPEAEGRWLRVVTTERKGDIIVVTVFFDRRLGREEKRR